MMHGELGTKIGRNPLPKPVVVLATKAFTLIELLVVIAIIGILAAILLPVLSRAKSKSLRTVDIGNLKQVMIAVQLYASDHRDVLPAPNWRSQDLSQHPGWLYSLDLTGSNPAPFKIEEGLIWSYLGKQKLYLCPMDQTNSSLFRQRDQRLSSYAMNGAVIGFTRAKFPPQRLSAMQPTDVAFWETDEKRPGYFNDGANYPSEGVSVRHVNGAINATFDGAVGFVRIGAWYVQVYETNKNALWSYPDSPDGR